MAGTQSDAGEWKEKYQAILVDGAFLADRVAQMNRAVSYMEKWGFKVDKETAELARVGTALKAVDMFLKAAAVKPSQDESSVEKKLNEGLDVARKTTKALVDRFKRKFEWFESNWTEQDSDRKGQGAWLDRTTCTRFFYGTRIPAKVSPKEANRLLHMLRPFNFDFFEYGYKAKKVNKRKGRYNWKLLDDRLSVLNEQGYPMSVSVNFGTMKPWPLMKKFSWLPTKFPQAELNQMLFRNDRGEVRWRSGFHSVLNIWHPTILEYQRDWLQALGNYCKGRNVAIYELFNEMGLSTKKRPVGYSEHGRASFAQYLAGKYEGVGSLNKALGTSYSDFGKVKPPRGDSYLDKGAPVSLTYEFERFRKESLVQYMKTMISELKKADTNQNHVISSQFTGWLNDAHHPKYSARDFLKLSSLDWDLYGVHCAGDGKYPAITLLYHYCINRYAKKIYWNDEFWWDYREGADHKEADESVLRAVAERNMWRHIAYGVKGFNIFPGLYSSKRGGLLTGNKSMRYSAGVFPVVMDKINKYSDIFLGGHILNQEIAILQPSTTLDITGGEFVAGRNTMKISDWMLSEHLIPFYVPEECIIDGREDLSGFRVLISPYAPFVPKPLLGRIDSWVKGGGIFLVVGPFGEYNEYGVRQETFVKTPSDKSNAEKILSRKHGKGKITVFPGKLTHAVYMKVIRPQLEEFRKVGCDVEPETLQIRAGKRRFTGERDFYAGNDIDLIPWKDRKANTYLFVINLSPARELEPTVRVKGRFSKVIDLGVDDGFPVPTFHRNGFTVFSTALKPGQGVIFGLY